MLEQKDIDLQILNDTIIDYRDQVQRLRECAERLQYETDAIPAIKAERDAYAAAADNMAASHKVERDALKEAAKLALDALKAVQWKNWRTDKAIDALKAVL